MEHSETPASPSCQNCLTPLETSFQYCPSCRQSVRKPKRPIRVIIREFLSAAFNLDSRMYQTVLHLAWPAYLTRRYFEGKVETYVHPSRMFLVSTVLMLTAINLSNGDLFESAQFGQFSGMKEAYLKQKSNWDFQRHLDSLLQSPSFQKNPEAAASLRNYSHTLTQDTSLFDPTDSLKLSSTMGGKKVAISDFFELSPVDMTKKYQISGFLPTTVFRQFYKFINDPVKAFRYLFSNISIALFLLVPLLALVLKLLYIRHDSYYIEHVIFTMNTHSFGFLLFALLFAFNRWLPDNIAVISVSLVLLYTLLSLKYYYRQGWLKTLVKFTIMNTLYTVCLTVFLAGLAAFSFLFF